jgi:hypothetical protein
MERGQGKIQKAVIVALGEGPKSVRELMQGIYHSDLHKHGVGIRQALRQLAEAGTVKVSDIYASEDGSRCWVLADARMRSPQPHLRQIK